MSKKVKNEYNTEFKERDVNMLIRSNKSTAQSARDLGVKSTTLYSWVDKAKPKGVVHTENRNEVLFDELKRL